MLPGRLLLNEFWSCFSPCHLLQLEEMNTVVDARQLDVSAVFIH